MTTLYCFLFSSTKILEIFILVWSLTASTSTQLLAVLLIKELDFSKRQLSRCCLQSTDSFTVFDFFSFEFKDRGTKKKQT